MTIYEKYEKRAQAVNSLLCVGLDADFAKLPERFLEMELPQFEFNKWIIDETHEYVVAFKQNSAFYEARGDQGIRELKMTMDYIIDNHPDIVAILDAKRGDIGNTNNGYVEFAFDWLGADALTISPYLGFESVKPILDRKDKASVVLCRTSNVGSGDLQDLEVNGEKIWEVVARKVANKWNANGNCMLVVGATYPEELKKIREIAPNMIFLVPGIGAQGGSIEEVMKAGKDANGRGLIISSSRGIIFAENPKEEARKLRDEIRVSKI